MSAHVHTAPADPNAPVVYEQYESIDQQQETYILGMWAFLVTEVMMFGALFLIYTLYRLGFKGEFFIYHEELNWMLGGLNTMNLLASSYLMAKAVRHAQLNETRKQLQCLWLVVFCGLIFLVIKGCLLYTSRCV